MVRIKDVFEIKKEYSTAREPGVVVIFDYDDEFRLLPSVGNVVSVEGADGSKLRLEIGEMKKHGPAVSFFFSGLKAAEILKGSTITWGEDGEN